MSQLVTQTTTYGLNSDQYSISTLSGVGGVLEIMAGNPHDEVTAPTPIADFKSDQSVKFYGIADLSNGVTLPEKVIGTKLLADKSVTSAKIAENVNIVGNLTGTASRAIADGEGNNIINTYATQTFANTLAPKENPTFTGTVTVPTPSTSDNSTKAASTAFVKAQKYATLASPTFTGTVSVPTPSTSDNSTKVASTAYVQSNLANYLPLSGGTMTGNLNASTTRQYMDMGYPYENATGALLAVRGADYANNPGGFELFARKSDVTKSLIGRTDGSLFWNGRNIVRSVNGTVAGTDGNVVLSSGVPTGTILPYCGTSAPSGFLICNGGEISRTTYSALFKLIGTSYGGGNGSTTFNLPNMHHRFLEGTTTTSEVNTYVGAGLPNIIGIFNHGLIRVNGQRGSFYGSGTYENLYNGNYNGAWLQNNTSFDASRSSNVYGNSTIVQPNSMRILFLIKF